MICVLIASKAFNPHDNHHIHNYQAPKSIIHLVDTPTAMNHALSSPVPDESSSQRGLGAGRFRGREEHHSADKGGQY